MLVFEWCPPNVWPPRVQRIGADGWRFMAWKLAVTRVHLTFTTMIDYFVKVEVWRERWRDVIARKIEEDARVKEDTVSVAL